MLHSTEQSMASTFTKTTENGGISIAQASRYDALDGISPQEFSVQGKKGDHEHCKVRG